MQSTNFLKQIILGLGLLLPTFSVKAQYQNLPDPGIYQWMPDMGNQLTPEQYGHYFNQQLNNQTQSYTVNLLPNPLVNKYNFKYALVALDTTKGSGVLQIVLLRDTVSDNGKAALKALNLHHDISSPDPESELSFSYDVEGDSITGLSDLAKGTQFDDDVNGVKGAWLFSNYQLTLLQKPNPDPYNYKVHYDSLTRKYIYSQTFTFGQSTFVSDPTGQIPFKDFISFETKVPLYQIPDLKSKQVTTAASEEYLPVLKDSGNWEFVMKPVVKRDTNVYYSEDFGVKKGLPDLEMIPGWIFKPDLYYPWVKQKQMTKDFRFEVSGKQSEDSYGDTNGSVDAIKIINRKTGAIQVIEAGTDLLSSMDNVVQVQDCNFDGYPDFWIPAFNGGAGPNYTNYFYLYNPKSGKFEFNEPLSDLEQVDVDSKSKTISSAFRDGCCHHGGATYGFVNNRLDTLSTWDDNAGPGYFGAYDQSEKINGKWQDSSYYYIYFDNSQRIKVYPQPKIHSSVQLRRVQFELGIHGELPLWFFMKGDDSLGHPFQGWVQKAEVLPQKWYPIATSSSKFSFWAASEDSSNVAAIAIKELATGKFIQIIPQYKQGVELSDSTVKCPPPVANQPPILEIQGYDDNGNSIYRKWYFDKKKGLFERSSK